MAAKHGPLKSTVERPSARGLWGRAFAACLAVLVPLKFGLVLHNAFASAGYASPWVLIGNSALFYGWDVVGAAAVATVVAAAGGFVARRVTPRAAAATALIVVVVHALVAALSTMSAAFVGSLINKAGIDLALLNDDASQPLGAAIAASVKPFLRPGPLAILAAAPAVALAAWFGAPRGWRRLHTVARRALATLAVAEAVATVFVLPPIVTGEWLGLRMHTYGLEKSPLTELVASYLRPAVAFAASTDLSRLDPWRFPLDSLGAPRPARATNPLEGVSALPRANVVLVVLESVGDVYLEQHPDAMPYLTSWGQAPGTVRFVRHYSPWPQTMKALFSLLCSEWPYPGYESITSVNPAIPCTSLPEAFKRAGYFTAFVTAADAAYDRMGRFLRHRQLNVAWDMHSMPGHESAWHNSWGIDERAAVRAVVDLVAQHRGEPFFLVYQMAVGHHPYATGGADEGTPDAGTLAAYLRALRFADDRLRDLVAGLESAGVAERTIVAVVSDHGEGFGQHPGARSHGPHVYEEHVRVPFALRLPQLHERAALGGIVTSHVDVAPTLVALAGLPVPCTMKGRDLTHDSTPHLAILGGRPPGGQYGIVDGAWKFIEAADGFECVFDLSRDARELDNVIDEHPEFARRARQALERWRAHNARLVEDYAAIMAHGPCGPHR